MSECKHFLIFYIDNDDKSCLQAEQIQVQESIDCKHDEINEEASKWMLRAGIGEFWLGRDFAIVRIV